jgi:type I restriction enzyme S subunit
VPMPDLAQQRAIAAFLDAETTRIDALIAKKRRMLTLLDQRVDARILRLIADSELGGDHGVTPPLVPIRRALRKMERWTSHGEMITAFRDGVVTTRSERGREGFTDAWTEGARVQLVEAGDVVVHGLDGFSGAIGDARRAGVCSPVYHVCKVLDGDSAFWGRMLRLLATTGYLGNFATSTRERAVDFRNWDLFGRIPVPDVPAELQIEIGAEIRKARPLKELIDLSEALAKERRQALVTAAVTGELSVPGVAA